MTTTCTKRYTDLPFSHRQPNHEGHCRFIHGHSWAFELEFSAQHKDACGFVMDFGALKEFKALLEAKFDHTLVLNKDDPLLFLEGSPLDKVLDFTGRNLRVVPDCSCEGLAEFVLGMARSYVERVTTGRVTVTRCTCFEDSKNSATAYKTK